MSNFKAWWCEHFHKGSWISFDWGAWHTEWDTHHGEFNVRCLKCGKMHVRKWDVTMTADIRVRG